MTFEETLAQIVEVLRRERRVSYRALRRRFDLDEEYLADLKVEIIQAKQLATDEDDTILVWTGEATPTSVSAPERPPLTYTPAHLSEKILTSRTALEGERKQVTVLFADIKGSTELIAGLDPEEARTLLDPALRLMMHAVHRYEGTVNQVLGDGIMALFGAPLAHEDHAVRACYAALAMQEAMHRYTEEVRRTQGLLVQMRVGLNSGEVDRAIVYGQRALALATTLGHVGLQARAHLILGRAYCDAGDYPRAVESLEWSVATLQGELLSEHFGTNSSVATSSRAWLSYCLAELGAFTEGLAMAAEGLRIAETVNDPFSLIVTCRGVGMVHLRQGDVHRAIPMLERGMGLCQDWHIPLLVPLLTTVLGLAYALDGRVAVGLALAEHEVEQAVARGRSRHLPLVVTSLSEAYLLADRLEEARQRAVQAVDLASQYQQRGTQAWALWLLGESTARQASPEVEPAVSHYRQALALAEELGMRPLQAHCHRGLGTLYARQGQRQQARAALATAIDLYRGMDMTFWLPQTQEALTQTE